MNHRSSIIQPLSATTRRNLLTIASLPLAVGALWCIGAFYHAFDLPRHLAAVAAAVTAVLWCAGAAAARLAPKRGAWGLAILNAFFQLSVLGAFLAISPERRFRDTAWQTPWRRVLEARRLDDGRFELRNVRDFRYRSEQDYDVRYTSFTVDPNGISSIDVALSHWDDLEPVAHSMLGLNFRDGTTVVISLETRLPEAAQQNALDGFYRRYGLAMLAGTPEDLYGLRTDHRGETLFVYRLDLSKETLRRTVLKLFEHAEEMRRKPGFYNSLFRNCTTGLIPLLPGAGELLAGDIRTIFNGLADKLLFDKDLLLRRKNERFDSLRSRCFVPGRASGTGAARTEYRGTSETEYLKKR